MTTKEYVEIVSKRFQSGISREHSYRGDLEALIRTLVQGVEITNEPANVTDCGNPDYVITKGRIPIGYIEAKDVGKDLNSKSYHEQFSRYKKALDNLIITDYVWFQFFQDGELVHEIKIGTIENNVLQPIPENYSKFENLIMDFCTHIGQTIKSSKKLAEMMAGKARLLQNILERAITSDEETQENTSLKGQYDTFKQILIHDLKPQDFADIYAQTLAYGMFAARLHDTTLNDFSRQEAAELIPKSNPFLRKLFGYIAGPDIDERIVTVVDNLAEVYRATNVEQLLMNFGKSTQTNDPIIHFYETFLAEYDPKLRKARGVWYTPAPIVDFIVRAVDDVLKTDFDLPQGLADTSKTTIKTDTQTPDKRSATGYKQIEQEVHKVQILDPATGTGTFLAEAVKHIHKKFEGQEGIWSNYVENHLLPRLNGFELLMASYAMAHLQLDLLLTQTGYKPTSTQRLRVYLTNSLEEHHQDTGTLFANWLSSEANEANHIKRDTPVMCVIGNPPYAVSSTNKSEWIENLTSDYKKDMTERNIQPLSDDYIKFIRYGQHYIDKNGSGVLAYISNNSFIDGIIHRQMRKNLLETFDKIYILDLHGNARKKEVCPDGSPDQNVFDIMQGVSINIFLKIGKKKSNELGKIFHFDLYGKRDFKYDFLNKNDFNKIHWNVLKSEKPYYFFVDKDLDLLKNFNNGINLRNLFIENSMGIATGKDSELVDFTKDELREKFKLEPIKFNYRPFDLRFTIFDNNILQRARFNLMSNYLFENIGLNIVRQSKQKGVEVLLNKTISNRDLITNHTYNFPLYLYPETNEQQTIKQSDTSTNSTQERTPNLKPEIVHEIAKNLGLTFVPEKDSPPLEGCLQGGVVLNSPTHSPIKINKIHLQRNFVEDLPYNPKLKQLARDKRKEGILSEVLFWQQVHKNKFHKIDFDRQRIIGNYIVDFYVKTLGLIIEIDGSSHDQKEEYDAARQAYLESFGLRVYRIKDLDVKINLAQVMQDLEDYIIAEYATEATPVSDHPSKGEFAPIDLLDYIYAVLHSPTYREKYKEFLKIDFPRVPYPKDKDTFWQLVQLGGEIRQIHLLESPTAEQYITRYPIDGDNVVSRSITNRSPGFVPTEHGLGKVYINEEQYFENVPEVAWEFYIGGYQPAQKWLKDRRNRTLEFDDILHYQKIIVALTETDRLMKEIDKIEIE